MKISFPSFKMHRDPEFDTNTCGLTVNGYFLYIKDLLPIYQENVVLNPISCILSCIGRVINNICKLPIFLFLKNSGVQCEYTYVWCWMLLEYLCTCSAVDKLTVVKSRDPSIFIRKYGQNTLNFSFLPQLLHLYECSHDICA